MRSSVAVRASTKSVATTSLREAASDDALGLQLHSVLNIRAAGIRASKMSEDGMSTGSTIADDDAVSHISEESETQDQPDFSGTWTLRRVEGDFEALMADAGVSWVLRKAARAANYGVGMVRHRISQAGDHISVQISQGGSSHTMDFVVGAGEQETAGEDGSNAVVVPSWDGQSLRVSARNPKKSSGQVTTRYFEDSLLVLETTTSTGISVKRYFSNA